MSPQTTSAKTGLNPLLFQRHLAQKPARYEPDVANQSLGAQTAVVGYVNLHSSVDPGTLMGHVGPETCDIVFSDQPWSWDLPNALTISGAIIRTAPIMVECTVNVANATSGSFAGSIVFDPIRLDQNRAELEALRTNADEDWDTLTAYAYDRASAILESCPEAPVAFMTTDSEGGIRMAWRRGDKQVRANFGARPDLRSYIYFESSETHGIEDLQATNLQKRLRWLGE